MKVPFDPQCTRFPYPESTDHHYLIVKKDNGLAIDKNYPYVDKSKGFRFRRALFRIALDLIAMPFARIRLGLKVEGKENLRKNKALLKKGVVSLCNHVHMWDYIGLSAAIWPFRPSVLSWAPDIRGENGFFIRYSGGIPIPEDGDMRATIAYVKQVRDYLNEGGWLQIYAEGSMWEYYAPIRPLKRGVSYFAIKTGKPVLPMAYSYRKPSKLRQKLFHTPALLTLHIGEPLFVDESLPEAEREEDLTKRCHEAMCRLAGIEDNIYPPLFDDSKRIDYYATEYGEGYTGSW